MEPVGMHNPAGGLAINQLLKLKAKGHITMQQFLDLTKEVEGFVEERPVELDMDEKKDEGDPAAADPPVEQQPEEKLDGTLLSFVTKHAPPLAKIATERKVPVSKYEPKKPVSEQVGSKTGGGRGPSKKKQGSRCNDVSLKTLRARPGEFPGNGLRVSNGQLFCVPCGQDIGSSKQDVRVHCKCEKHKERLEALEASGTNLDDIKVALDEFVTEVKEQTGKGVLGMSNVPKETMAARAECVEEFLKAGVPIAKIDKFRPYLERRMGISLTASAHMSEYIPPLKLKEEKKLRSDFSGEFIGVYSDGTTHNGESFVIVFRACKEGFKFLLCAVRVRFLRGSMSADQISAELIDAIAAHMQIPVSDVLAWMTDCVAANLASYRDSLAGPFPYSDHNGCLPHTGHHVGEAMETPHVDEYMGYYNLIVGQSNYAVVYFTEITGYTAKKKSATRWFSVNDVQELSLLPNALNGKLLKWVDKLIEQGIAEKTAPKMRAFLLNPTKSALFVLELTCVVFTGKPLKARNTKLEGDTFEFITGYDTIVSMGDAIKHPMTTELKAELQKLAVANGAAPAGPFAAAPVAAPAPPAASILEILSSLTPTVFKTVNLSVDASFWDWHGETPPQPRYSGKPTSWFSQEPGNEQPRIKWEKGRDDEGKPQLDGNGNPLYAKTAEVLISKLLGHGLRLEPFDDGAAPPTLTVAAPAPTFLLGSTDFSDMDVLIARAEAVVSPAAEYFRITVEGKRGAQLARMKAVRFFNPLHILANGAVTEEDIDGLDLFRFAKHPKLKPKILQMKSEINQYNTLIKAIKPAAQRRNAKGEDTFDLGAFWRENETGKGVDAFAFVLRAVLANSPNSIPPERVFSILNDTFDDDMDSSHADYIELSLQLQYNERSRE